MSSSSFVLIPDLPRVARFCLSNVSKEIRFKYPWWVINTAIGVFGVKSSIVTSPCSGNIWVFLSSPYFSLSSKSSPLIILRIFWRLARISSYSAIFLTNSSYSALTLSCSNPVNLLNCISRIAFAWSTSRPNLLIKPTLASSVVFDFLISSITSSIEPSAIIKPAKMWALILAFFKKKIVLLVTISTLCSTNSDNTSYKFINLGCLPHNASILTPKVVASWVYLNKLFLTTSGLASRLSSITIRIPSLSDSSRISEIPVILWSLTSSAIFSIKTALFTW